jgi:hypothetical protein
VVIYRRVEWAIDFFAPYKRPGVGWHIPGPAATGSGGGHPIPGQNFSYLPGDWLCSRYMATGKGGTHQLVVYLDDVNILDGRIYIIEKHSSFTGC